jgi:hypothetical protein
MQPPRYNGNVQERWLGAEVKIDFSATVSHR